MSNHQNINLNQGKQNTGQFQDKEFYLIIARTQLDKEFVFHYCSDVVGTWEKGVGQFIANSTSFR
ncbi:hypothetical protein FRX31_002326 [Thalictrum thalictroides]|uniref:Uncharacterized protein n=1 Tax=Thalictrum thalictroides TaxID=46969 RepID=A0A7J6XG33_THATH|nr:hypothetical protein FRX31_002326 [Thalictrum thalictroides]